MSDPQALDPSVASWIEAVTDGTIVDVQQIPAGGRLGWFVDVRRPEGTEALFLQSGRGLGDGPSTFQGFEIEAEVYRALRPHGLPVPRVWGVDKALDVLLVDRIPGTVWFHPPATPEEQESVARDFIRHLATWHRIGAEALDLPSFGPVRSWREHQLDQLAKAEALMAAAVGDGRADPLVEQAMAWLRANVPDAEGPVVLVQGDTGPGNFLYEDGRVTGIIDWELAHLGDPVEDLGWYCVRAWRFGSALPAGGMGTREELLDAYEAAGGGRVDPEALRWWELLGTVKWGLICVLQAQVHLSGASRSVELATIGRRVCENEWDVLGLLPGGALPGPEPAAGQAGPDLYGRPTAAELLEAVREWVEGDVREATSGRVAFHARVAANALAMLERQVALGPAHEAAHRARLESLGHPDDASLARAIRAGEEDHRLEEVRAVVAASVRSKLEVANPRWLEPDR